MIEEVDWFAGKDRTCKRMHGHVSPSTRPISGEESQAGRAHSVEMAVRECHQFVGSLRCCIQADRLVDGIVDAKRQFLIHSIARAARSIDQMGHRTTTTTL